MAKKYLFYVKEFWNGFLNLIFPLCCVICRNKLAKENAILLCPGCSRRLKLIKEPFCGKCGRQGALEVCPECKTVPRHYRASRSAAVYEGVMRESIHRFKYGGELYLRKLLGKLMVDCLLEFPEALKSELIVPVPLQKVRERERGFNQSLLLSEEVRRSLRIKISNRNLVRVRAARPQTELSRAERLENVRGIFAVKNKKDLKDKTILLIDDVLTTGSTVDEASRILLEAGAEQVFVLTAARGE